MCNTLLMEKNEQINDTLRALRDSAGLTVRAVSEAIGLKQTGYQRYEDPLRFKKKYLPYEMAKKLADLYSAYGVNPKDVLALANDEARELLNKDNITEALKAPIVGEARLGQFSDNLDTNNHETVEITPDERYPNTTPRIAYNVKGNDAGETIPKDSIAVCIDIQHLGGLVENGKFVIVERKKSGLIETSVRRKALHPDGSVWLETPRSATDPIPYDHPDIKVRAQIISVQLRL